MNTVTLFGRLGADPDLTTVKSGDTKCTLSVATSESWKSRDGNKHEKTEWHRVIVWGAQADVIGQYMFKGSRILITGSIEYRDWEDDTGTKRYITEIKCRNFQFVDKKSESPERELVSANGADSGADIDFDTSDWN